MTERDFKLLKVNTSFFFKIATEISQGIDGLIRLRKIG